MIYNIKRLSISYIYTLIIVLIDSYIFKLNLELITTLNGFILSGIIFILNLSLYLIIKFYSLNQIEYIQNTEFKNETDEFKILKRKVLLSYVLTNNDSAWMINYSTISIINLIIILLIPNDIHIIFSKVIIIIQIQTVIIFIEIFNEMLNKTIKNFINH